MRQRRIGSAGDDRLEGGSLETGVANLPVDVQRDLPLGAVPAERRRTPRGDVRQTARRLLEHAELVGVFRDARALDDPVGGHERWSRLALRQASDQPVVTRRR